MEIDEVDSLLADRPDLKPALEEIRTVDATQDTWTFDDISVDSGEFGELAAAGIVESVEDGYHLSDPEVVDQVLYGDINTSETSSSAQSWSANSISPEFGPWLSPQSLLALGGILFVMFVLRITQYQSVFRGEHVVSPGNDPYYYRYWLEQLLAESIGLTDVSVLARMPERAAGRRPLAHASNWFLAEVLGGGQGAAETVAAWLPVVSALALGIILYFTAMLITDDIRVGITSVLFLAVAPIHTTYTGLGFLEHRLHQYFWLGVTLLSLAWLTVHLERHLRKEKTASDAVSTHINAPSTWIAAGVLGVGLTFSNLSWGGGPLLLIPLGIYLTFRVMLDLREGVFTVRAYLPVTLGIGTASVFSGIPHLLWDWHMFLAAFAPSMLFGGVVVLLGVGEVWRRSGLSPKVIPPMGVVLVGGGLALSGLVFPEFLTQAISQFGDLLFREGATESVSLFSTDQIVIFGPLTQIGVGFYFGIAALVWMTWRISQEYEPTWLLLATYSWWFLVLSVFMTRFGAQLTVPLSIFAGLAFVYFLSWVDLARRPARHRTGDGTSSSVVRLSWPRTSEDIRTAGIVLGISALLLGFSLIFVFSFAAQTAYDDAQYGTAMAIEEHKIEYENPAEVWRPNLVLSHWDDFRMYNYFVNGYSGGYGYSVGRYDSFLTNESFGENFYSPVDFLVIETVEREFPEDSAYVQLHERIEDEDYLQNPPHEQFRLIHVSEDRNLSAFAVVPGAHIEGSTEANSTVSLQTTIEVSGAEFEYVERADVNDSGEFEATVLYPGTYEIDGTEKTVTVSEKDIREGDTKQIA